MFRFVSVIDRLQLSKPNVYRNNSIIVNLLGLGNIDNIAGFIHWPAGAAAAATARQRYYIYCRESIEVGAIYTNAIASTAATATATISAAAAAIQPRLGIL